MEGKFVSRGGLKIDGALDRLGIDVAGVRALDAGASTGGFTDCLLQRGASHVVAVDVAYGEFAWTLRNDERVTVVERTNIRYLTQTDIGETVDLVVADLAFISLRLVRDALLRLLREGGDLLLLVKPQFELPKDQVPRGGVVTDRAAWRDAMVVVAAAYSESGCTLIGVAASQHPGPKGNREFFLHLRAGGKALAASTGESTDALIDAAIEEAP